MMRYWTTTTTLYCPRCKRQTRQVVENRVALNRVEKKTTCYRCLTVVPATGPTPWQLLTHRLQGR